MKVAEEVFIILLDEPLTVGTDDDFDVTELVDDIMKEEVLLSELDDATEDLFVVLVKLSTDDVKEAAVDDDGSVFVTDIDVDVTSVGDSVIEVMEDFIADPVEGN